MLFAYCYEEKSDISERNISYSETPHHCNTFRVTPFDANNDLFQMLVLSAPPVILSRVHSSFNQNKEMN